MTANSFFSAVGATPRVLADYYRSQIFWDQIPWALIGLAISAGGAFAFYLCIKLAEIWTQKNSNTRYELVDQTYRETTKRSHNALIRLVLLTIGLAIAIASFWVASNTAGFNFWTVILGYGILSLIGTYAFGTTLKNIGAFFLINLTDKIEENWVVTVAGVTGRITGIHILWVEVVPVHRDELGIYDPAVARKKTGAYPKSETQIPTWMFLDAIVKRTLRFEKIKKSSSEMHKLV
jgi:small-conductance mechanosensitive channel